MNEARCPPRVPCAVGAFDQPTSKSSPDSGGTLIVTRPERLDRLAARAAAAAHRHRYYGVLAPNAPLRQVVTAMTAAGPRHASRVRHPLPRQRNNSMLAICLRFVFTTA